MSIRMEKLGGECEPVGHTASAVWKQRLMDAGAQLARPWNGDSHI